MIMFLSFYLRIVLLYLNLALVTTMFEILFLQNCEDDTSGAQCQTCRTGYHGNALSSIPGDGCEVCACPRPSDDHK